MPIPFQPSSADLAALQSYIERPNDDTAAIKAITAKTGWVPIEANAYLRANRDWLPEMAAELRQAAQTTGGNLHQAASLSAERSRRQADLAKRSAAFAREMATLIPPGKTTAEAMTEQEVADLLAKHGLTIRRDGQLALAADTV